MNWRVAYIVQNNKIIKAKTLNGHHWFDMNCHPIVIDNRLCMFRLKTVIFTTLAVFIAAFIYWLIYVITI